MRIAYLLDWNLIEESSVIAKIVNTIKHWEGRNHEVYFIVITDPPIAEYVPRLRNIKICQRPKLRFLIFSSVKTFFGRNSAFNKARKYLKRICPDVLYYRPGSMWYPNISRCLNIATLILEINSVDENEVKLYYNRSGFRYNIFYYGRRKIISQAAGIVALTDEISDTGRFRGKPKIVIANGIDFESIGFHKSQKLAFNSRPQIIFVGTPGQVWQGFDKFAQMAVYIPSADFHLVGPSNINCELPINLKIYGFLSGKMLLEIYKIADIGVGTLALHRKNMNEACPLKVREYIRCGLPVIVGYKDTDLDGQPFVLNIGCYENNVKDNLQTIENFIERWHRKYVSKERGWQLLGLSAKEDIRLAFLEKINDIRSPVILK